jgi:N utilization substance protein B
MGLTPYKLREIVFHLLYSADFAPMQQEEVFPLLMSHHKVTKKSLYAAEAQTQEIQAELPKIDEMISSTATEYEFNRIPRVERNLLRLGVFEICFSKKVPPAVAISEAVRLARKFSSAESAKFVNAILDALYKRMSTVA